jgi:hypothetical protein
VWVTVEEWYERIPEGPLGRPGSPIDISAAITIYQKPDQGFIKLLEESSEYKNLLIDSSLITRVVCRVTQNISTSEYRIIVIEGMLGEMCRQFQDRVYFNGMKEIRESGKYRGASGKFGNVEVLCTELCEYDRVMLQDQHSWVTFQQRPGDEHMYVLGQCGTVPQIRNLVDTVIRMWNENPETRTEFTTNPYVSVI